MKGKREEGGGRGGDIRRRERERKEREREERERSKGGERETVSKESENACESDSESTTRWVSLVTSAPS